MAANQKTPWWGWLILLVVLAACVLFLPSETTEQQAPKTIAPTATAKVIKPATLSGEERVWDLPSGKVTIPNPLVGVIVRLRLYERPRGIEFWVHGRWDHPSVMFLDIGFNGLLDEVWVIDKDAKPHIVKPGPLEPLDAEEAVDDEYESWKVWEDRYLDVRFEAAYEESRGESTGKPPESTHKVNFPRKGG